MADVLDPTSDFLAANILDPEKKYIAVDLDGTLAFYFGWSDDIGEPVPLMLNRVKAWLLQGRPVCIFTARVCPPNPDKFRSIINAWCWKNLGQELPITCIKQHCMEEFWDDRGICVLPNTGTRSCIEDDEGEDEDS